MHLLLEQELMFESAKWFACLGGLTACLGLTACRASLVRGPALMLGGHALRLEGDIGAGYVAYQAALEPWGRWASDSLHGVHWCPA